MKSIIFGSLFFILCLISCSFVVHKPTSAEISIKEAEKVLEAMPEGPEKTIIKISLDQSKKELSEYKSENRDLAKEKEKAVKIAQNKSESAGKWEGIRNTALFIGGAVLIGIGFYLAFPLLRRLASGGF